MPKLISILILAMSTAAFISPAKADIYDDVQKLSSQQKFQIAIQKADEQLEKYPNDAQMKFIKSQVLQDSGEIEKAQEQLEQMTQQTPELAEPWNNLAVIYASKGQLENAANALEQALKIRPNYQTAAQNLADTRLKQAINEYKKASQLSPLDTKIREKIKTLETIAGQN